MAADWSELLPELLGEIAKKITHYEDLHAFGDVCSSWLFAAASTGNLDRLSSRFPSLMLAETSEESYLSLMFADETVVESSDLRQFLMLSNSRGLIRKLQFGEGKNRLCLSSRGWLFVVDVEERYQKLVHPLQGVRLDLPNLDTIPSFQFLIRDGSRHFIKKMVLSSSNPSDLDFLVTVIYGGKRGQLGFCKPGDISWKTISYWPVTIVDATYLQGRGRVYAVDIQGYILVSNPHEIDNEYGYADVDEVWEKIPATLVGCSSIQWLYLLESPNGGEDKLLVVSREEDKDDDPAGYRITKRFQVFEFDLRDGKWDKIENLGNRAIFVGYNSSFSIEACEGVIKANCIYFTDDVYECYRSTPEGGGKDMGIYHLSDGTIEPLFNHESRSHITPPIWIEPCHDNISN